MTNKKNLVPVYYDTYEPWEHFPTHRTLLAEIPADAAGALADQMRKTSGTVQNTCMFRASITYDRRVNVHFNAAHADTIMADINELCIYGIMLDDKPHCTRRRLHKPGEGRHCIRQMRSGKCVCPAGRILGAALWPQLYAKNNENIK